MSELEKLFKESKARRVIEARQIPQQAVNFLDVTNEFQNEFETNVAAGDATGFTDKAQHYFDEELKQLTSPDGTLHKWNSTTPYGAAGDK